MAISPDALKQMMNTLREHLAALENIERPDTLSDLVTRFRDLEQRMNDMLPRVQRIGEAAERLRQIHDDVQRLQNAIAA
jgi:hypothetical protein